jgi:nitrite reductase (NADH) small subunit
MRRRVASIHDIPEGGGIAVDVGEKRIALIRAGDELFALDETCPHRGGPLHEGVIVETVLSCPWHAWQFDLKTGCSPVNPLSRVRVYAVTVEGEEVWIEAD